jgi:diacylglycerol kinase family enzyme
VKIEVIVNKSSGVRYDAEIERRLPEMFAAAGADARIVFAETGDDVIKLASKAMAGPAEIIVAGGGDGTISSVASLAVEHKKVLGVLPLGTMNHFAKDLQIPLDLEEAVRTILDGRQTSIDVGDVNGEIFINNSSLGLYPTIVRERERQQRLGWSKGPAYIWAAVATLRRYPFLGIRLSIDGDDLVRRTPFVFIGNNEYQMEAFNIGSRACLDNGELSLYILNRTGRRGLFRIAVRALLGRLQQDRDFFNLCTKEIWIDTKRKYIRVALDGEVKLLNPPLHYRVRPRVLRVLTPPGPTSNVQSPTSAT